ncbi:hypothetical protein vseg_001852 [Gypsophila vaccaria]
MCFIGLHVLNGRAPNVNFIVNNHHFDTGGC